MGRNESHFNIQNHSLWFSFPFLETFHTVSLPDSITLGSHSSLSFSDFARNLGVIPDSNLSMKKHVIKICQTAYFELNALVPSAGFSLKMQPRLLLLPIIILSQLDYCNCLLMGTHNSVIQPLQKIHTQDSFSWHPPPTPLLEQLHWLHNSERIKYKVACMCFNAINGSCPAYLSGLLHVYTPSHTLHFLSDSSMLKIQQYKRKTHGFRTFSCFGPHIWNSLL